MIKLVVYNFCVWFLIHFDFQKTLGTPIGYIKEAIGNGTASIQGDKGTMKLSKLKIKLKVKNSTLIT